MTDIVTSSQTILVVGGGISGITAALEASECGKKVILVEKKPAIGGRVSQLYRTASGYGVPFSHLEMNLKRVDAAVRGGLLDVLTLAEVTGIEGEAGGYSVGIRIRPRYVNANCTACGDCSQGQEVAFTDEYNEQFMGAMRGGVYSPYALAYPQRYVIDPRVIGTEAAELARSRCRYSAVDFAMDEEEIIIDAGAVVVATGWTPFDAGRIHPYGYGRFPDVISSLEFERMADPTGPTGGRIVRPSSGGNATDVAFIQCAGSRDRNYLSHCSGVCCIASLKQSRYINEACGDKARVSIYYLDIRVAAGFEDSYQHMRDSDNVSFIRSKVSEITSGSDGRPICRGVDTESSLRYENPHDLVVLAVGMEPNVPREWLPSDVVLNEDGFMEFNGVGSGVFSAGVAAGVADAEGAARSGAAAAMRAIQVVNRVAVAD